MCVCLYYTQRVLRLLYSIETSATKIVDIQNVEENAYFHWKDANCIVSNYLNFIYTCKI